MNNNTLSLGFLLLNSMGGMSTAPQTLTVGDVFPELHAQTLKDQQIVLPEAARGKFTVLATGFSMEAQTDINSWTDYILVKYPDWNYYEVAIGNEYYAPFARRIDNEMKREVPRELHDKTATYYGSKCKTYKRLFGVQDEQTCYVFLLNAQGEILCKTVGGLTEAIKTNIENTVKSQK